MVRDIIGVENMFKGVGLTKYHINPETMRPNICRAKAPESCPYYDKETGIPAPHFETKPEAREYAEEMMKKETGELKTISKSGSSPPYEVSEGAEIFIDADLGESRVSGVLYNRDNLDGLSELIDKFRGGQSGESRTVGGLTFTQYERDSFYPQNISSVEVEGNVSNFDFSDPEIYRIFGFSGIDVFSETHRTYPELAEKSVKTLTESEKRSIFAYTGSLYRFLNKISFRRDEFSQDHPYFKVYKRHLENLDTALAKAPKIPKIVYRSIQPDASVFTHTEGSTVEERMDNYLSQNYRVGEPVSFLGHQSASTNPAYAKKWGSHEGREGVFFEILTPEGLHIKRVSRFEEEDEVLLPRESHYVVAGVQKSDRGRVVQLVAINKYGDVLNGTNADQKSSWEEMLARPLNPSGSIR